ncbi:MAG: Putative activity regulator of membrane protease YbbK, partial [uncultured Nocardioides sp.]
GLDRGPPLADVAGAVHRARRRRDVQPRPDPRDAVRRCRGRHDGRARRAGPPDPDPRGSCGVGRHAHARPAERREAAARRPRAVTRTHQAGRHPGRRDLGDQRPQPRAHPRRGRDLVGAALRRGARDRRGRDRGDLRDQGRHRLRPPGRSPAGSL